MTRGLTMAKLVIVLSLAAFGLGRSALSGDSIADNADLSVLELLGPAVEAMIPGQLHPAQPSPASMYSFSRLGDQQHRKRESQTTPSDVRPTPEPTGESSASTTVHIIDEHDFALLLPNRPGGAFPGFGPCMTRSMRTFLLLTGVFHASDAYRTHLGCRKRRRGVLHARERGCRLLKTRLGRVHPGGCGDHRGRWLLYPGTVPCTVVPMPPCFHDYLHAVRANLSCTKAHCVSARPQTCHRVGGKEPRSCYGHSDQREAA